MTKWILLTLALTLTLMLTLTLTPSGVNDGPDPTGMLVPDDGPMQHCYIGDVTCPWNRKRPEDE